METKNSPVLSQTTETIIKGCRYIVTTHYKENARETAEQKLMRYVSMRIDSEIKSDSEVIISE